MINEKQATTSQRVIIVQCEMISLIRTGLTSSWIRPPSIALKTVGLPYRRKLLTSETDLYPSAHRQTANPGSKGNYPINKDAQQALKKKNRAYRAWMSTSDHREREACRGQYTKARNKAKTLLRKAKRTFEKNIAEQAKSNPKAFWSHTRSNLKTKSIVAPLLENPRDPKSLKFNDVDKANILQRQFSSVYTREPDGIVPIIENRTGVTISDMVITEDMVRKELRNLNPNKSCGPDDIHSRMLIELADLLAGPITLLFNQSFENSTLPREWKQAFISPIFKKGSKSNAENYRPISLTSILCKIMESFIRESVDASTRSESPFR